MYKPAATYRLQFPEQVDKRRPVGENPPNSALVSYYLKTEAKNEITLDILDGAGKPVRHYSSKPKNKFEQPPEWPDLERPPELLPTAAGMNRFPWNLRHETPTEIPGAFYAGNGPEGPIVLPGTYTLKLTAAGKSQTVPLEIKTDPRVKTSEADLQRLFDLEMKVRQDIEGLHTAVNQIRSVRSQLELVKKRLEEEGEKGKPGITACDELQKKMAPVEEELKELPAPAVSQHAGSAVRFIPCQHRERRRRSNPAGTRSVRPSAWQAGKTARGMEADCFHRRPGCERTGAKGKHLPG